MLLVWKMCASIRSQLLIARDLFAHFSEALSKNEVEATEAGPRLALQRWLGEQMLDDVRRASRERTSHVVSRWHCVIQQINRLLCTTITVAA